ncbi:hypothetical protein KR067_008320 [Drosophila pandora]|nr:hypothetical protein KR067_008320 [Drosophila pandora]
MMLAHGIILGWFSLMYVYLSSDDSPLDEKLTVHHGSWIGSVLGIGSLFINLFMGFPLDHYGRKPIMYFLAVPHAIHWILIYFGTNVLYHYVARFLAGISGGAGIVVFPVFVAEISDTNIRGALGSSIILSISIGILLGYIFATFIEYKVLPCIALLLPIIYTILIFFLPETPLFLLRCGKTEKAEKSFYFYKSLSVEDPESKKEFKEFAEGLVFDGPVEKATVKDYCNREAWKAYGLISLLLFTHQMSGNFAILTYATTIFENLDSRLDSNLCTIILGVAQLLGMILAVFVADHVGRRLLLLVSLGGMALGELTIAGLKFFASKEFLMENGWCGLATMCLISFFSSIGVAAVTVLIIVEILPIKIISVGTSMSMALLSLLIFMTLKIYPMIIEEHGLGATMIMSATVCILSSIILGIFLPETSNKHFNKV